MSDTGFTLVDTLVDRRTVLVVIFSMILAHILWGFTIPIDATKDIIQLLVDLSLLIGYIYLVRSIYRLPVALIFSFHLSMFGELSPKNRKEKLRDALETYLSQYSGREGRSEPLIDRFQRFIRQTFRYVMALPSGLLKTPFFLFRFGRIPSEIFQGTSCFSELVKLFVILDRVGLIAISIFATVPSSRPIVNILGVVGLILMVGVFVIFGSFTAIVQDPIEKEEMEKQALLTQAGTSHKVYNSQYEPLYVTILLQFLIKQTGQICLQSHF